MFPGFTQNRAKINGVEINFRRAGSGPPVLLLHGYPQTHAMWHEVAPALAQRFSVVLPDLRGYGDSAKPQSAADHLPYSKRVMAQDMVGLMAELGWRRFVVVGHDRGGRVAYRMALDHPDVVTQLATLDIVPTIEQWESLSGTRSVGAFHWMLLAQPSPIPEKLISVDPGWFLRTMCGAWAAKVMGEHLDHYVEAFTPDVVRATCDDYRAGATIDVEIDRADRDAGRRITCPMLALWGDPSGKRPSLLDVWRRWAVDVRGHGLPCGHFLAEEAPDHTLAALDGFLVRS